MDKMRVYSAAAVAVIKDGKVLMGKRTNTKGSGSWCFPGGALEPGETALEGIKRELLAESGIHGIDFEFMGFVDIPFPPDQFWITLVYRCTGFSGEPSDVEAHKIADWTWFSPSELPSPMFGHTQAAFDKKLVWKD